MERRAAREAQRATEPGEAAFAPAAQDQRAFNILVIAQHGRLAFEAALFCASLRLNAPDWKGRLIVAEPLEEGVWKGAQTRLSPAERSLIESYGAEITPFAARHFGRSYPYGNKIEALQLLPPGAPFIFFDSDTVVTGPIDQLKIDFTRPTASMRRTGTWPQPPLYGPGYDEIWISLYDRFGLDFASSLDTEQPDEHWERYLYFNAGWFLGPDPKIFAERFLNYALAIRETPGEALACQSLDPWLDQVALPLVIHALGGGRPGPELDDLDGDMTCHYRTVSLLYARESEAALQTVETILARPAFAPILAEWPQVQEMVLQGTGRETVRPLFDRSQALDEARTRHVLKKMGLWQR